MMFMADTGHDVILDMFFLLFAQYMYNLINTTKRYWTEIKGLNAVYVAAIIRLSNAALISTYERTIRQPCLLQGFYML